jgi:hypothetical protein
MVALQEQKWIHLNDILMDIMDYIWPATCSNELFRSMWAEFEWENKVALALATAIFFWKFDPHMYRVSRKHMCENFGPTLCPNLAPLLI